MPDDTPNPELRAGPSPRTGSEADHYGYRDEAELLRLNPKLRDKCGCGHERGQHHKNLHGTVRHGCKVAGCRCERYEEDV